MKLAARLAALATLVFVVEVLRGINRGLATVAAGDPYDNQEVN